MNKVYRCPNCTKASYDYGFCSRKCENEFPEKAKDEVERLSKLFIKS